MDEAPSATACKLARMERFRSCGERNAPDMDAQKEAAIMVVAMQMAVRIDENTPRSSVDLKREPDQIRADLIQQYKACYDEVFALHDKQPPPIPPVHGAARRKSP